MRFVSLLIFLTWIILPGKKIKEHRVLKYFWDKHKGESCSMKLLMLVASAPCSCWFPPSRYLKQDKAKDLSLPMKFIFSRVVPYEWWNLRVLIMWNCFVLFWSGGAGSIDNLHTTCWVLQELSQCLYGVSLDWCFSQKWSSHEERVLISVLSHLQVKEPWGCCCSQSSPLLLRCLFCLDERLETFVNHEYFHKGQEKHFLASLKHTPQLEVNSDSKIL